MQRDHSMYFMDKYILIAKMLIVLKRLPLEIWGQTFRYCFTWIFLCCLEAYKIEQSKVSQKWSTSDRMPSLKLLLVVLAGSYMVSWWLPAVKLIKSSWQSSQSVLNQCGLLHKPFLVPEIYVYKDEVVCSCGFPTCLVNPKILKSWQLIWKLP